MKKRTYIAAVIFVMTMAHLLPLFSQDSRLGNLTFFGESPLSTALGGTGVSEKGVHFFIINPASLGHMDRYDVNLTYGSLDLSMINPSITLALPVEYGVLGIDFRMYYLPGTENLYGYNVTIGTAKDITSWWSVGLSVNVLYSQGTTNDYYAGVVIGTEFHPRSLKNNYGFGFVNPSIGFSIHGGVPLGPNWGDVNMNSFTAGFAFSLFSNDIFDFRVINDYSFIHGYTSLIAKGGMEFSFIKSIHIRVGTIQPLFGTGLSYGDITAGLGYSFSSVPFSLQLDYSFSWHKSGTMTHYVGMNLSFGALDLKKPAAIVTVENRHFSPDGNGVKDRVVFYVDVKDDSELKSWYLKITDDRGRTVKTFSPVIRGVIKNVYPEDFNDRMAQRRLSRNLPRRVEWYGFNDHGVVVKDGSYRWAFAVWDNNNNIAPVQEGVVVVDRELPKATVKVRSHLADFSNKEKGLTFIIDQHSSSDPGCRWTGSIVNSKGTTIRSFNWKESLPEKVQWDGLDDTGKLLPQGTYGYHVTGVDSAGNRKEVSIKHIFLLRQKDYVDVQGEEDVISLEKRKNLSFSWRTSLSARKMKSWKLIIENSTKMPVLQLSGTSRKSILWHLTDDEKRKLSEGKWFYRMECEGSHGMLLFSDRKVLMVDRKAPVCYLTKRSPFFSPDGDGENDLLVLRPSGYDEGKIASWKIDIFSPSRKVFKSFTGEGSFPQEIVWNGYSDSGELVEGAARYSAILTAVDEAGNSARSRAVDIPVDILLIKKNNRITVELSAVTFRINSAELTREGKMVLKRLRDLLVKYRKYQVDVRSHTDDVGEEEYNMELSENRAVTVIDFLTLYGIDRKRLSFTGMGESSPLYPNTSHENRRRNRRIEFILSQEN